MSRWALAATASTAARISSSELMTRIVILGARAGSAGKAMPGAELRSREMLKSNSPVVMCDDYSPDLGQPVCDLCP